MRHLHYLHSPRHGSVHLANYTPGDRIAAAVSLSGLDLGTIAAALPAGLLAEEALVVSRVFAFDWAPRNTRSEERRVGKECGCRGSPDHEQKKEGSLDSMT